MTPIRLLTTAAAVAVLTGLAPSAQAQTAAPTTEKAAAASTGKSSTDAPAATAVQGTARAVQDAAKPVADQAPAAAPMAAPAGAFKPVVANGDLVSTLRLSGQFTTLTKALDATNLSGLVSKTPNLTLFAPTDAAFAALPPGKLDALMADKAGLQKLLLHHVINAPVPAAKIKGSRGPIPSGAQDTIIIDGSADVLKADNANIIQADVMASNGTLHVVDAVLMVGSVPATLPEAAPAPETAAPAAKPKVAPKKK